MLTNNTVLLQRFDALKKQVYDTEKEIISRMAEKRVDNDGYIIHQGENGKYGLVSKEFYVESMMTQINLANQKLVEVNKE